MKSRKTWQGLFASDKLFENDANSFARRVVVERKKIAKSSLTGDWSLLNVKLCCSSLPSMHTCSGHQSLQFLRFPAFTQKAIREDRLLVIRRDKDVRR